MAYNNKSGMYEGFIYMYTNKINGAKYIGQTRTTVGIRDYQHFYSGLKDSATYFDKILVEIGKENFELDIIETIYCETVEELTQSLNEKEIFWISYYDTYNNPEDYNKTPGGQLSENLGKPVIAYDTLGNMIGKYQNMHEAQSKTNIECSQICTSCKNPKLYLISKGLIFRYDDDELTSDDIENIKMKYPIITQYLPNGSIVNQFRNKNEILKYFNISEKITEQKDAIGRAINHGQSYMGYIWRAYPDKFEDICLPSHIIGRKIEQRDPYTGELINMFNNAKDAYEKTGINASTISNCCNREKGKMISNQYYWGYEGEYNKEDFYNYKLNNRVMKKYLRR